MDENPFRSPATGPALKYRPISFGRHALSALAYLCAGLVAFAMLMALWEIATSDKPMPTLETAREATGGLIFVLIFLSFGYWIRRPRGKSAGEAQQSNASEVTVLVIAVLLVVALFAVTLVLALVQPGFSHARAIMVAMALLYSIAAAGFWGWQRHRAATQPAAETVVVSPTDSHENPTAN